MNMCDKYVEFQRNEKKYHELRMKQLQEKKKEDREAKIIAVIGLIIFYAIWSYGFWRWLVS